MFRWIVAVSLVLVAYGVLYHNLPCWAQFLDKTFYCQLKEEAEKERQFAKAHHGKTQFDLNLEKLFNNTAPRPKQLERSDHKKRDAELKTPPATLSTPAEATAALPEAPSGTVSPVLIHQVDAEYSEEARKAKYQGTVVLYVEVDPDGDVVNPRVIRSLGLSLDEKAIEAVRKWKFKPAYKDGRAVTAGATVEVNFRLVK